ncbi:MAG: hypothetical protein ACLU80_10335 [Dorea sp.]
MLIPPEEETIEDIKKTVEPIIGIYGHKNLYYDIVRTGRKLWISVYITFDKDIVSLSKFKHLQDKCIKALAQKYQISTSELLPDIEFTGIEEEENTIQKGQVKVQLGTGFLKNPVPKLERGFVYTTVTIRIPTILALAKWQTSIGLRFRLLSSTTLGDFSRRIMWTNTVISLLYKVKNQSVWPGDACFYLL